MNLPSAANKIAEAANKIAEHLETLNASTANISVTLTDLVNRVIQPLYDRVDQLESKIQGNDFRDHIRQGVQDFNDQVLDQKINVISTHFDAELKKLKQQCDDFEKRSGSSYVQADPQAESQGVKDTVSDPGNEPKPKQSGGKSAGSRASL